MFGANWEKLALMPSASNLESDGVIQNSIATIFKALAGKSVTVYASFLSIFNEQIFDLLQDIEHPKIKIRETRDFGIATENLARYIVKSEQHCRAILQQGSANLHSRRSIFGSATNTIFTLTIVHEKANKQNFLKRSSIFLCDLAASEGLYTKTDPTLHKSISNLRRIIAALGDESAGEVPYNGGVLTRLL